MVLLIHFLFIYSSNKKYHTPQKSSSIINVYVIYLYNRKGIEEAEYMQLEIEQDKETHCLQPKPITGRWERICTHFDYYCYDFASLFTTTAEALDETDYHGVDRSDECIRRRH